MTLCLTALALVGCLPIPNVRQDLVIKPMRQKFSAREVQAARVSLPGAQVFRTPARYNKTFYVRYRAPAYARPLAQRPTILVVMPGIFAGASSLDVLARQLIATDPGLEVWAIDRRANGLEDQRVLQESLRRQDPEPAFAYYVTHFGREDGFRPPAAGELDFLRYWGLEAHLQDLHKVVLQARAQGARVVLGGHSLGASMVSFYAAHRFKKRMGADYIDALLLIDGSLGRTGAYGFTGGLIFDGLELIPGGKGYQAGRGWPLMPIGSTPRYLTTELAWSLRARFRPQADAAGSRVPMSNLAYWALQVDDNSSETSTFSPSLGHPVGAVMGGNLPAFLIDGWQSRSSQGVLAVAAGHRRVEWRQGEWRLEPTGYQAYLQSEVTPQADFYEWYFPLRLLVDMSELPLELMAHPAYAPHSRVQVPTLAVGAGRGLVQSLDGFAAYSNLRAGSLFSSYVIPGFTHLDITAAKDNPLVPLLLRWLEQTEALALPKARAGLGEAKR